MALRNALADTTPLRRSRRFRRLWVGRGLSGFGSQMTIVAVMFQVWTMTRSTVWTGAVGLAQAVPLVACGLFAGALVDRADRRRVYLVATTGQAMCSLVLAGQDLTGHLPVTGILAVVAVQSVFGAAGGPAARTFITRLLPTEQVAAGLALNRITFQAAMLIGPAIAGLVIASSGVGGCYVVDAVSFGLAFYGAFGLPAMRSDPASTRPRVSSVLDGLGFVIREPVVRGALLTDLAATVLSFPISLFPLVNAERFHGDPRTFGLFLTAIAIGGLIASVLSGWFTRSQRPARIMLAGSAVWGASIAAFGAVPQRWIALGLLVVAGAADTVAVVCRGTIVQLHTPDGMRGRVAAAEQIVGQAGPDIGNMRAGLLASATSGTVSLISGGLMCVAAVAGIAVTTPALRLGRLPMPTESKVTGAEAMAPAPSGPA